MSTEPKYNDETELGRYRRRLEMSQTEFAKLCEISQELVSTFENRRYMPKINTIKKVSAAIAKSLKIKPDPVFRKILKDYL